jgi:DNA-binding LacI/PurR family transcriptional regulator
MLLFQTEGDERGSTEVEDMLFRVMDYPVDGLLILNSSLSSSEENLLRSLSIPIVMVSRTCADPMFSSVGSDNHEGGRLAAHALVQAGCKRIAYMAGLENASTQIEREQGFRDGLAELGTTLYDRVIGHYTDDGARHATRVLFSKDRRPDALFAANDLMAMVAMDTLKSEFRLQVPRDVSVVGFDNISSAAWPSYGLTTIDAGMDVMAKESVRLLMELVRSPGRTQEQIRVPVSLVMRSTVRLAG